MPSASPCKKQPKKDLFAMDRNKAFNRLNHRLTLQQAMRHHSAILLTWYGMYKEQFIGWFYDLDKGIEAMEICEGAGQGDTHGSLLYCIGTMPFDIGLKEVLGEYNLLASFIVNKNIQAPIDDMLIAID